MLRLVLLVLCAGGALAQTIGAGNARALAIAARSPVVKAARARLERAAASIRDPLLRRETQAILRDSGVCVVSRKGVDQARKRQLLQALKDEHLIEQGPDLESGVFPPLKNEASDCPEVPQSYYSAPGSSFHGHHSYPGGLTVHVAVNEASALSWRAIYRDIHSLDSDSDILTAAPLWHDWAKTFVFQWNADGTESNELSFGGDATNGTKTPAHHILGLAESMARGLPAELIITQASAHAAPTLGNEPKVVNWLRAAAILAGIDPVARGLLVHSADGWRLKNALKPEYALHNLSDADFVFSGPAVAQAEAILEQLAPEFHFAPSEAARYNWEYRNPVLSNNTAEGLVILFNKSGLSAVSTRIRRQMVQQSK